MVTFARPAPAYRDHDLRACLHVDVHAWDGAVTTVDADGGEATLALTGSPVLLVER